MLCLENLYVFMDFIAYCYGEDYKEGQYFKPELVLQNKEINAVPEPIISEVDLQALIKKMKAKRRAYFAPRRAAPDVCSEAIGHFGI